ncbi:MAG: hypothetical protein ACUVWN_10230 [bacterium]
MPTKRNTFVKALLSWHKKNFRAYPWRLTTNPYEIWVAEVLLRKTKADQVVPIYKMFIARYPTVESLSKGKHAEIEEMLSPLGFYNVRTKGLIESAKIIMQRYRGKIPDSEEALSNLPGSGKYIVLAVQCFAFGMKKALLDTNFVRVYDRVFNKRSQLSRPRTDSALWKFSEEVMGKVNARKFNLAMLDFASLICTKKQPKCKACVMKDICQYYCIGAE